MEDDDLIARVQKKDETLVRLDITSGVFQKYSVFEKDELIQEMPANTSIRTVHLSGSALNDCFHNPEQVQDLIVAIGAIQRLDELCVFRSGSEKLTEDLVATCLQRNRSITVLMLWGFSQLAERPQLAKAMRMHPKLERVTITLPNTIAWASLDVYAMGLASMTKLSVLQLRCQGKQKNAIISPEGMSILLSSKSIDSLYLENVGLLDDHIDAILEPLSENKQLTLLDLKENLFTDDALYTFSRILKVNNTLKSLDLSGIDLTEGSGQALAAAMPYNTTLTRFELEGDAQRYQDEFDVPVGHSETVWMVAINHQIRLNRANEGRDVAKSRAHFAEALNSVSDNLDCLYHFVRLYPIHCARGEGGDE